ncbi:hypothetical protein LOK49_LG07G02803 [Camellia lanceoleosa]|uniref:Uncharacterized protein n=1 Tax=Camellia lanceoleosa TaxID=1840588 RepID=A0ACC0GXY3_9ERIC|nr:hypothetical protein LOK49_LG07G02803 [Camellia lanceoleosa]
MSADYSDASIGDDVELDDDVSQGSTKRIRKLTSRSDSSDSMSSIALVSENSSSSGSQLLVGSSTQESLAAFHAWRSYLKSHFLSSSHRLNHWNRQLKL